MIEDKGERAFADFIDKLGYDYLYIDQAKNSFGAGLYQDKNKRPDFFVNTPHYGNLFFEVKTRQKNTRWIHECFPVDMKDHTKLARLQRKTGIKTWYAHITALDDDRIYTKSVYTIPHTTIKRFYTEEHKNKPNLFDYVLIPTDCFTKNTKTLVLENKCENCGNGYCEDYKGWIESGKYKEK